MKAYKLFDKDLKCENVQFEVGETYVVKRKTKLVTYGFDACTYFDDIFEFDDVTPDCRVCEVELLGDIEGGDIYSTKVSTNKIKIVRELSVGDFLKIGTPGSITKAAMIGSDEISDEMISQLKPYYRMLIAELGADRHRDCLVHDIDWGVRRVLAQFGTKEHKDILVHDEDVDVRMVIAKYGDDEHRDILVNDESADVRGVVAQYGNDKHKKLLTNDESSYVRDFVQCGTLFPTK